MAMMIQEVKHSKWALTDEAKLNVKQGKMPETIVYEAVKPEGISLAALKAAVGKAADIGFKQAMQKKWIAVDKSGGEPLIKRIADDAEDIVLPMLKAVEQNEQLPSTDIDGLKKRKLVALETWTTFLLTKGPEFALEKKKKATDLTFEMMQNGTWRAQEFKEYNFKALGTEIRGGHLHPLLKVRTQFRKIFLQMGFEEMPTNNYVESSFWNFDALFQPQQHPARDAHDTFFLTHPAKCTTFPEEYLERVRDTHENGGFGSFGYGYNWKRSEAEKNLLRTHTTAVSSRMLYKLAQEGFRPAKYFSIDRVFRNEAVDRTHLAEFHQVEGLICDRGLSLADLIGVLRDFFARLGLPKLRFKPAYNPYTEPSMEIFSYHEALGKWVEVGNSGMFRPEMLRPMGLPEDCSVIAWGLGVERPTMILYEYDNIRDLFSHKVNLSMIKENPICRINM